MADIVNPTSLKTRQLQCRFILQSGTFDQGFNTAIYNNNTINAVIHKSLTSNFTMSANITVYGMNPSDIAALSTVGYAPLKYELNKVQLYAQYSTDQSNLCFSGYIVKAYADFSDPSRPMHFECQTTYLDALNSTDPVNVKGSSDVTDIFSGLAAKMGLSFQNNGVTGIINNLILTGSPIDQLKQLSKQTQSHCVIDNGKLKICPKQSSLTNEIVNINKSSGLISYPSVDVWGVKFRIRYNPVIELGQYVALQTKVPIPKSIGKWYIYDMESSLNNRHENWYTDLKCSYNNQNFG